VFTAGSCDVSHLDGEIVHVSPHLANRARLHEELAALEADTYLTELKAAAIDVVAEHALAHGGRVVLATNEIVGLPDRAILDLLPAGVAA
jgi:cyclic 2,3-diphosphoglycerate synthetase